ncbi:MAG TPA: efflux RND transporter periplasmic adaptor subunit [Phycisphaerales bacterium]|nr:efflux RND transporter periplasmic adaptor subunit [Phycisphaerales bacterium]
MWKWVLAFVVIVAALAGAGTYFFKQSGLADDLRQWMNPESKPKTVRVGAAIKDDLVRTISTPGEIEPKTKVEISAQVSARIIALPFRENDRVKAGDVLIRLDARDLQALLESAKASLKSEQARYEGARAALENALSERTRRQKLAETGDISKAELDQFETEYRRAESAMRVAEHSIEIAKANILRAEKDLDNTTITAPFDGVVTKLNAEVGETVVVGTLNNPGSIIMEVADLGVMLLKAKIDEANIAFVKEGQKARVYVNSFPDTPIIGTVEHVGLKKEVDKDMTAYFLTDIVLEAPADMVLRSGMTANADIEVETYREVIKVPSQAVLDRVREELPAAITADNPLIDKNKKFVRVVYVMNEGKARSVPVTTGASDLTDTMILRGLKEGDRIIVGPFKELVNLRDDHLVMEEGTQPDPAKSGDTKTATAKDGAHGG